MRPTILFHPLLLHALLFCPSLVVVLGITQIRWVELLNNNNNNNNNNSNDESSTTRRRSAVGQRKSQDDDVQELYTQQSLDHFRLQDDRTFSQRYFYTDRFVRRGVSHHNCSNGNEQVQRQQRRQQKQHKQKEFAFLCVGGEGPALDKSVLVDSVHCTGDMIELAKILYTEYNASVHLYALEHRYYGKSYPTCFFNNNTNTNDESSSSSSSSPISNENLVYLSSRQSLADLSNFVSTMNAARCCKKTMLRWVTFGGSYPGMLAAWARLQFPHLIHAAVSNSAPIQAQLDFPEYNSHVSWALQYDTVGGSRTCLDIVHDGHAEVARRVLDPTRHVQMASDFNLCNATSLANPKNVQLFLGDGVYDPGAQDNDPSCSISSKPLPRCNIAKKCQALVDAKTTYGLTSYETLRWIVQQDQSGHDCKVLDWQGTLDRMASTQFSSDNDNRGGLRSWIWQTCTEFGFYQTCQLDSDCPFGRGWHNVSQDLEICNYAFGVHESHVIKAVQETLAYYGGWKLKATRVLSVNGNVDPWSELALVPPHDRNKQSISSTTSTARRRNNDASPDDDDDDDDDNHDPDRPTWMVPGASHHFWTHAVKDTDSPEVVQARQVIYKTVLGWLFSDDHHDNNHARDQQLFGGKNRNPATRQT
jgi:thymus-specific serine protease